MQGNINYKCNTKYWYFRLNLVACFTDYADFISCHPLINIDLKQDGLSLLVLWTPGFLSQCPSQSYSVCSDHPTGPKPDLSKGGDLAGRIVHRQVSGSNLPCIPEHFGFPLSAPFSDTFLSNLWNDMTGQGRIQDF